MSAVQPLRFLHPPVPRGDDLDWTLPFRALISRRLGLALPARYERALVRALDSAGAVSGLSDPEALLLRLTEEPWTSPLWQAAIGAITIRETSFFRQTGWWHCLARSALTPLIEARRNDGTRSLRCLSIGCSSGDEPYSLAITLDRLLRDEPGWSVEIVGLDLSEAALAEAAAGIFDQRAVREVSALDRERWFRPLPDGRFELAEPLRRRVSFRLFNLAEAAQEPQRVAVGPADLVICRNLIIHMEAERQPGIARYLAAQLRRGGFLAVAPVEATPAWFAPLHFHAAQQAILFEKPRDTRRAASRETAPERVRRAASPPAPSLAEPSVASPPPMRPAVMSAPRARRRETDPLGHARRLADSGLFLEARRLCEQILDGREESHLLMALVCQSLGDLPCAQEAAQRALAAAPRSPAAHYVMAIICLRAGRAQEARRSLRDAVRLLEGEDAAADGRLGIAASDIRLAARRLGLDAAPSAHHGVPHG